MLKLYAKKQKIEGEIALPASKSISNRALIINALNYSPIPINNLGNSEDVENMYKALHSNSSTFYTGDGGTTIRFLTAYLARIVGEWHIECSERMSERPIRILVEALNSLGAQITYTQKEGYPPLKILGSNLTKNYIKLSGDTSSQYITALLLIAPTLQKGLTIELEGKVVSRPYIEMSLKIMSDFGISYEFTDTTIKVPAQAYKIREYTVESDWSAASYWYEILCLAETGEIKLLGLRKDSCQGDSQQVDLWEQLGVHTQFTNDGVVLSKKETNCKNICFDFNNMPDLAQTFAVCCAMKNIHFEFSGLETLKIKETNRIEALIKELKKLGVVITEPTHGQLKWIGEKTAPESDICIATYRDHRMAMAFAPVALLHSITIKDPSVVNKSYPGFWKDLKQVGLESA